MSIYCDVTIQRIGIMRYGNKIYVKYLLTICKLGSRYVISSTNVLGGKIGEIYIHQIT